MRARTSVSQHPSFKRFAVPTPPRHRDVRDEPPRKSTKVCISNEENWQSPRRRWRVMSDTYSQPAFGQPTFIESSASGSLSGRDEFRAMDATTFYNTDDHDYSRSHLHDLHISSPDAFSAGQQFSFASHNTSGVSLPGYTPQIPSTMNGHMAHQFEHEHAIQPGLDSLDGFSPLAPSPYTINPYRTPYPDSNATSTSSATSPDPTSATLMNDPVIVEADEDKRKRNQAASARFRQKKKQREQQLVESTREMQDRTKKLELENDGLKKENLFLKKLLVEKVDHMTDEDRDMLRKVADGVLDSGAVKKKKH